MRKIFGLFGLFAIAAIMSFAATAAPATPSRAAAAQQTVRTMGLGMNIPGGVTAIGGGPGNVNAVYNVPTSGPHSCVGGGCYDNNNRCINGVVQSCALQNCASASMTCVDGAWGPCTCNDATTTGCNPGDIQDCTTSDNEAGQQVCQNDGTWGACVAKGGGTTPGYTVDNCMDEMLACVNGGALPGGIKDLYNYDLRNSIINGMGLCQSQVDKCVNAKICNSSADCWIIFNTRVVQPSYYSFVLRNTGLTPYQAENTCMLLDKNTYGKSFAALGKGSNQATGEYNQNIGSYNEQGGPTKENPQGYAVNTDSSYDGARGHYARWDATGGQCLVRVAAYKNDNLIADNFTALFWKEGSSKAAEAWVATGSNFKCDRALFEMASLLNSTRTAAATGGILAGVGVVAGTAMIIDGAHKVKRDINCSDKGNLEQMYLELSKAGQIGKVNQFLPTTGEVGDWFTDKQNVTAIPTAGATALQPEQCKALIDIFNAANTVTSLPDTKCGASNADLNCFVDLNVAHFFGGTFTGMCSNAPGVETCTTFANAQNSAKQILNVLKGMSAFSVNTQMKSEKERNWGIGLAAGSVGVAGLATAITYFVERGQINCRVGDGLDKVAFGKSGSIGKLKDFYVKWALNLPDNIQPTGLLTAVNTCSDWRSYCETVTARGANATTVSGGSANQCPTAQLNWQPLDQSITTLISGACKQSGSVCVANDGNPTYIANCIPPETPASDDGTTDDDSTTNP